MIENITIVFHAQFTLCHLVIPQYVRVHQGIENQDEYD